MLTISTLGATSLVVSPSEPGASTTGVPTNATADGSPAASAAPIERTQAHPGSSRRRVRSASARRPTRTPNPGRSRRRRPGSAVAHGAAAVGAGELVGAGAVDCPAVGAGVGSGVAGTRQEADHDKDGQHERADQHGGDDGSEGPFAHPVMTRGPAGALVRACLGWRMGLPTIRPLARLRRAVPDRIPGRLPGRDAAGHPRDVGKPGRPEERRGNAGPVAAGADRRDRSIAGQRVEPIGQVARPDQHGAGHVGRSRIPMPGARR